MPKIQQGQLVRQAEKDDYLNLEKNGICLKSGKCHLPLRIQKTQNSVL